MCKQLVSVKVTSLKAGESLVMIKACYHLSGNLHWLDCGVSGIPTTLPFPRTVSNLAIFRKTLAILLSQVVLDHGRAFVAAEINVKKIFLMLKRYFCNFIKSECYLHCQTGNLSRKKVSNVCKTLLKEESLSVSLISKHIVKQLPMNPGLFGTVLLKPQLLLSAISFHPCTCLLYTSDAADE